MRFLPASIDFFEISSYLCATACNTSSIIFSQRLIFTISFNRNTFNTRNARVSFFLLMIIIQLDQIRKNIADPAARRLDQFLPYGY